jgi:hypothetical protein
MHTKPFALELESPQTGDQILKLWKAQLLLFSIAHCNKQLLCTNGVYKCASQINAR